MHNSLKRWLDNERYSIQTRPPYQIAEDTDTAFERVVKYLALSAGVSTTFAPIQDLVMRMMLETLASAALASVDDAIADALSQQSDHPVTVTHTFADYPWTMVVHAALHADDGELLVLLVLVQDDELATYLSERP